MPGQVHAPVQASADDRIAALERRIQALEQQVQQLLNEPEAPKTRRLSRRAERTTGPLPRLFVSLLAFANLHTVAESTVQTHVEMGVLPVKRGKWTDTDGVVVTLACDAKGGQLSINSTVITLISRVAASALMATWTLSRQ